MELDNSQKILIRLAFLWMFCLIYLINIFFGHPAEESSLYYVYWMKFSIVFCAALFLISIALYKLFSNDTKLISEYDKHIATGMILLLIGSFYYLNVAGNLNNYYDDIEWRPDLNPEAYVLHYEIYRVVVIGLILISLSFLYSGLKLKNKIPHILPLSRDNGIGYLHAIMLAIVASYPLFGIVFAPFFENSYYGLVYMTFCGYPILMSMLFCRESESEMNKVLLTVFSLLIFTLWIDMVSESYIIVWILSEYVMYLLLFGCPTMAIIFPIIIIHGWIKKKISLKLHEGLLAIIFSLLSIFPWLFVMSMGT